MAEGIFDRPRLASAVVLALVGVALAIGAGARPARGESLNPATSGIADVRPTSSAAPAAAGASNIAPPGQPAVPASAGRGAFGGIPVFFEANTGQVDASVRFLARGSGYTLFLTEREAVLALAPGARTADVPDLAQGGVLRMKLGGAGPGALVGVDTLPSLINYLLGDDRTRWRTGVPAYRSVRRERAYEGVDLVFHSTEGRIEYDLVVAPGTKPESVTLEFEGADRMEVDAGGDLLLFVHGAALRMRKPFVYQAANGARSPIEARYALRGKSRVGFVVAAYDPSQALVIDPVLVYSRYIGSSAADRASAIAVDDEGNGYVTGTTQSSKFPVTGSAFDAKIGGNQDAFVAKLAPDGSLVYATYLGGGSPDSGNAIAVDAAGRAIVVGQTQSGNFPTTTGSFDGSNNGSTDAFVSVLDPNGSSLVYSTFLGGSGDDMATGVAVADALVYVVGHTTSTNFPTTAGAYDRTPGGQRDAFVAALSLAGAGPADLVYSTFLGGAADDLATGVAVADGFVYVAGETASTDFPRTARAFRETHSGSKDAFVAKLHLDGNGPADLRYASFLGGAGDDGAAALAVAGGDIYVAGYTRSGDFPATSGAFQPALAAGQDAFVAKLHPAGAGPDDLVYSTFLGGTGDDFATGIAVRSGVIDVTGATTSGDFPATSGAFQPALAGGQDAFVARLRPAGAGAADLVYSTFFGGDGNDVGSGLALDTLGNILVAGETSSATFPGAINRLAGLTDAFVVKLHVNTPPVFTGPGMHQVVNEETPLAFTLSATEPDGQTLTYSIASGAVSGMALAPGTGVFTWTPTEAQGPGTYAVTFQVSDGEATDQRTITITVNEVNRPPVLGGVPASATIDAGAPYTFTATASDPDLPANQLTFALRNAPAGAAIDPRTGVFAWTPTEAQGPGDYSITVSVTDNGLPPLSGAKRIAIHVNEVNNAPVLVVPGPQATNERGTLTFGVSATDPAGGGVTVSVSNLPPGATFDPLTGTFTWTPTSAQGGPNPYIVFFTASDGQNAVTKTVSIAVADTGSDRDGDGILDSEDNCPDQYNPDQVDVCHTDSGASAALSVAGVMNTTNGVNVTVSVTFSGGPAGIAIVPVNLFNVICRVTDSAGHQLTTGNVPEGPPIDLSALTPVPANSSLTSTTTFDLGLFYPNLPAGTYALACDYVNFAHDPHMAPGDTVPWKGVVSAPPQTIRFPVYAFTGFSSPLPGANFSQTNTVPVKFSLKDSAGAFVTTCKCTLTIQRLDTTGAPIPGTQVPATPTNGKGDDFRYDSTSNQYVFNLSGKSLPLGPVQLQAHIDDGTIQAINIVVVR